MIHQVLTRSCHGPDESLEHNRHRLELTKAITIPSLLGQTADDWTWVVAVHCDDPLLTERLEAIAQVPNSQPMELLPPKGWPAHNHKAIKAAARVFQGSKAGHTLTSILDDDDFLMPDLLESVQQAFKPGPRTAYIHREGAILIDGKGYRYTHQTPMFQTLASPPGDNFTCYDYGHNKVHRVADIHPLETPNPAWVWVRHGETWSHQTRPGVIGEPISLPAHIDWQTAQ